MAINKKSEFESQDVKLADIAKALSHPARVAIVKLLVAQGTVTCGKIVDQLPLSQSTVSQHLKDLKECGLIKARSEGVKVEYSAVIEQLKLSGIFFNHFFEQLGKAKMPVAS